MFEYKYRIPKTEFNTTYGSIGIKNIIFEPGEIEKALPDVVLSDENLKHMFAEEDLNDFRKRNIYKRFIPKTKTDLELDQFIDKCMSSNVSFYSFLAEGILGLVFRDLYDYQLAKGIIDVNDTLSDSHTGVDACMYDLENSIVVLGEAKFYGDLYAGINKIIEDFTTKSIKNKLESLQTASENCIETSRIIIKNLGSDCYDELTVEQFMNQTIVFAGFVLHSETDISKYCNTNFYDIYELSTQALTDNIKRSLNVKKVKGNYEIIMVHLPISNKKDLIAKMIETSRYKLLGLGGNI